MAKKRRIKSRRNEWRYRGPDCDYRPAIHLVAAGGGKGGGGGHTATEDPDTAASRSEIRIKEILTEGESAGPALPGLQWVALDGTPVQDAGGAMNFTNFDLFFLPGTQDQSYIPGFEADENSEGVGVRVRQATPWVRRVSDTTVDAIRLDVKFPQMVTVDPKTGDRHGATARVKVEVQSNNAGYVEVIDDTVNVKATSPYVRTYAVTLAGIGPAPWDIRVTRVTADSETDTVQNQTWIDSFTQVTWGKLRHPNRCMVAVGISAEQFGSVPVRSYCMLGVIIKVPSNYNPTTREYATEGPGTTMGADDVQERGLGRFVDVAKINKWALYTAGQICDQPVPDGRGGTEPRYTCALYLQEKAPAIQVMNDIASIFRAMVYYASGWLVPVQDSPGAGIAHQFTLENVVDGKFQYSRASRSVRHTEAIVAYSDMTNFGKTNYVYVEDEEEKRRTGKIITTEIAALGCTSPAQAYRLGKWLLLSEKLDRTIAFKTGQEGMFLRPGDVIETHDPYRSGRRYGGRVKSATIGEVELDTEVTIEAGKTYWVSTLKQDGSVERHLVDSAPGVHTTLSVSEPFENAPDADTVWILVASDLNPERWRVIHVVPEDLATCQVTALEYSAGKFETLDGQFSLDDLPTSVVPSPNFTKPPGAVSTEDVTVNLPLGVRQDIHVSWVKSEDPYVRRYRVSVRFNQGNWLVFDNAAVADAVYKDAKPGIYEFAVEAVNVLGVPSAPSKATHLLGVENPLTGATVSGLEIAGQGADHDYRTADVQLAWRITSPANAAQELDGDDARFDPFFEAFLLTIYDADTGAVLQPTVPVTQPTYDFTLQKNKACPGGPFPRWKAGVAILDKWKNVSAETFITVNKLRPLPPANPSNLIPTIRGVNPQWTNQEDTSRRQINIYMDSSPDELNPGYRVGIASANSSQKSIDGIANTVLRSFWVESEDVFGLRSTLLFLGFCVPGQVNDIAEVTFNPDGGALATNTIPDNQVYLTHPDPAAKIYYKVNPVDENDLPSLGDLLYDIPGEIGINDPAASIIAAAYVNGLWGPAKLRAFTTNTGGGGPPDPGDAALAPGFDPPAGTYTNDTGDGEVTASSVGADAIFYTRRSDTVEPADPTHDGSGNPTGATIKAVGDSAFIGLTRGRTRIKAIAVKAGFDDSTVAYAVYTFIKEAPGL
jgi:hypothetical protein